MTSVTTYVGLGANLGDREAAIRRAAELLPAKRDLLGARAPAASARTIAFKNRTARPTILYADVFLARGAVDAAAYSLSATARR